MEIIFFVLLMAVSYSYFIYPIIIWMLPKRARTAHSMPETLPSISLIVTAHNEIARIVEKLDGCLMIDYPADKLEIIVASDCSNDGTDEIVMGYADKGIKLVKADQHLGKEYAQSLAIDKAQGDILVFSDVATHIEEGGLLLLAEEFEDSTVGAISSEDSFISKDGSIAGEGLYVRYEMWLRQIESQVNSIVGLSGSFFAIRKEVARFNWDIYSPSDFNSALNCQRLGLRAVSSSTIKGYYKDIANPEKEYARKIRTVVRGMTGLSRQKEVLNPFRFGLFSFQLWSHKVMRWLEPWLMLLLLSVNTVLWNAGCIYQIVLLAQVVFYGLAYLTHRNKSLQKNPVLKIIYFFCQVNFAMADAGIQFIRGTRVTVWTPTKR